MRPDEQWVEERFPGLKERKPELHEAVLKCQIANPWIELPREPEVEYQMIATVNGEEVYRYTAPVLESVLRSGRHAKDAITDRLAQIEEGER